MRIAVRALVVPAVLMATALVAVALWSPQSSRAADAAVLTGAIQSGSGDKMEGVTVSARAEGATITASVFTDKDGNYYFPPLEKGKYRVWAQAIGFEAGRAEVDLAGAVLQQNFTLEATQDFVKQLPGGLYVAALPVDTSSQRRMRDVFVKNCTTCHTPALVLQNRFDQAGWEAIITMMSRINAQGVVSAASARPNPVISHYKKELAAYLAEVRGPATSPMKFHTGTRPAGDATLPVIYEYDLPLERGGYTVNDGSDWSFGTPSNSWGVRGTHDASMDLDGNIWFSYSSASKTRTYGKVDTRTGEVTDFTVDGVDGMAANTHGMMRAPDGMLWFNVSGVAGPDGKRLTDGIGRVDPKTGKMNVFTPADGMAPVIGHVDVDGKGFVWGATTVGAVRLDPKTGEFREFKSLTTDRLALYGVAGDRMGNGWWAEISIDKVGHSDIETGKSLEFDVPPNRYISQGDLTEEDRKVYQENGIQSAPWAQGPRRLSADKNGDDIWVGLYAGNNLMRLNSRNLEHRIYPAPAGDFGLYMPVVDSNHNVWVDLQGSDAVERFDVKTEKWTRFDWPSRGAAPRHLSLIERDGFTQLVTAFWGTSRVGRMVIRTEKDLQALKAQVQNLTRSMVRAQ